MFKTIKRIIDWCGEFKGKLYIGFLFSFLSTWAAALPCFLQALFGQSCKIFLDIVACPFWTKLQSLTSLC